MDIYQVKKIHGTPNLAPRFRVRVPGSKSITNRALLLAMLSDGGCGLSGALFSDDSRYLLQCIEKLGIETEADEKSARIFIRGLAGKIPKREARLYVGSAGTAARFLTALLGLKEGKWYLDASEQMRRRPMRPLLSSLQELGARVAYEGEEGHFPFTLFSERNKEKRISVDIGHSSQFLSALLIAAGSGGEELEIAVEGSHGMAYIDMTVRMMEQFGVPVILQDGVYRICGAGGYVHRDYEIEPDVSGACYFYAMAALLGVECMVEGVHFASLQGDVEFLRVLERMGCTLEETAEGIRLQGPFGGRLKAVRADLHACSDQAITLAAIAPFADGPVEITGIGHIRYQESDRIKAMAEQLGRIGIRCEEREDSVRIHPGAPMPGRIETYDDHRMAMGFSLVGLRAEGIEIEDPGCCRKTFENYFRVLDEAAAQLTGGGPAGRTVYSLPSQQ